MELVPSPNHNERKTQKALGLGEVEEPCIVGLVLHYTAIGEDATRAAFSKADGVSAHYTVLEGGQIWQHVDER